MVRSLQQLGYQVPFQDATAPVEINLGQPYLWEWSNPDAHHIGMTAWESTGIPAGWVTKMNTLDELWTPSPLIARWYQDAGVTVPVKVYEHGVDPSVWTLKRRVRGDKIKFLHIGEPAPRKHGKLAVQAFREAFGDREDVHLTIKANGYHTIREENCKIENRYRNVTIMKQSLDEHLLVDLVHRHHVMVYPSAGEGFGLIPLQAMVTGMPTICTSAWAPYQQYLIPNLRLSSALTDSRWPDTHPGMMFEPSRKHLVELYQLAAGNYDSFAIQAYGLAKPAIRDYDWISRTESALKHLEKKFSD